MGSKMVRKTGGDVIIISEEALRSGKSDAFDVINYCKK